MQSGSDSKFWKSCMPFQNQKFHIFGNLESLRFRIFTLNHSNFVGLVHYDVLMVCGILQVIMNVFSCICSLRLHSLYILVW